MHARALKISSFLGPKWHSLCGLMRGYSTAKKRNAEGESVLKREGDDADLLKSESDAEKGC